MSEFNPYAPPKAEVSDVPQQPATIALWNPNAAANWSLLFSPAFGAYLHMLNWRALGEPDKAAASRAWVVGVLLFYLAMSVGVGMFNMSGAWQGLGLVALIVWYFSGARAQAKYIRERFGDSYPRRPWGKALLWALGVYLAYLVVAFIIGAIIGLVMVATR